MLDLIQATQDAVFAALAASTDPAAAPVFQHVRQDTVPPFNRIGRIDTTNIAGKGEQIERLTVEIHSVFRGEERGPLLDQMHAVRNALDPLSATTPLAAEGVAFGEVRFVSAVADDVSVVDGLTYVGVTVFDIIAEPA